MAALIQRLWDLKARSTAKARTAVQNDVGQNHESRMGAGTHRLETQAWRDLCFIILPPSFCQLVPHVRSISMHTRAGRMMLGKIMGIA
jgi:hypothetical protein